MLLVMICKGMKDLYKYPNGSSNHFPATLKLVCQNTSCECLFSRTLGSSCLMEPSAHMSIENPWSSRFTHRMTTIVSFTQAACECERVMGELKALGYVLCSCSLGISRSDRKKSLCWQHRAINTSHCSHGLGPGTQGRVRPSRGRPSRYTCLGFRWNPAHDVNSEV